MIEHFNLACCRNVMARLCYHALLYYIKLLYSANNMFNKYVRWRVQNIRCKNNLIAICTTFRQYNDLKL